jgi:hypothetical protein
MSFGGMLTGGEEEAVTTETNTAQVEQVQTDEEEIVEVLTTEISE